MFIVMFAQLCNIDPFESFYSSSVIDNREKKIGFVHNNTQLYVPAVLNDTQLYAPTEMIVDEIKKVNYAPEKSSVNEIDIEQCHLLSGLTNDPSVSKMCEGDNWSPLSKRRSSLSSSFSTKCRNKKTFQADPLPSDEELMQGRNSEQVSACSFQAGTQIFTDGGRRQSLYSPGYKFKCEKTVIDSSNSSCAVNVGV